MSFGLPWNTLAVLKGGMRILYSGADPARDRGCTELLPRLVVSGQGASALRQLWALSHVSMIIYERSYWAVRSTKIWLTSRDRWNVPWVTDLVRPLIFFA